MKFFRAFTLGMALAVASVVSSETPDLPTRTINGKEFYYYEVPKKETIYSITRKFGFTRDEIIQYNPQVRDGLRAGDTLLFPVTEYEEIAAPEEEEIAPAEAEKVAPAEAEEVAPAEEEDAASEEEEAATAEEVEAEEPEALNVAVMLSFMLEAQKVTRQAENNTNFYRGMLLAVQEHSPECGVKINIHAYDTEGSAAVVAQQMAQPELSDMDYIIAPSDSLSIERIAAAADSSAAMVMNFFAVKNQSEMVHESLVQGNIQRDVMYDYAIEAFCRQYATKKVIILHAKDLVADKQEFIDGLTAKLIQKGIPYEQIDFEGLLTPEVLSELPMQDYVFVPTSASREVLLRILSPLTVYNETKAGGSASLFGYPEWVTIRGEVKSQLHSLNTVIYSRFSTALDCDRARKVQDAYKEWYGQDLPQAVPNTVLLGYDVMTWLLYASVNGVTDAFDGVQNAYRLQSIAGGGYVNTALYFITFKVGGKVEAVVL